MIVPGELDVESLRASPLDPFFGHRFRPRQLIGVDLAMVLATSSVCLFLKPGDPPRVGGASWQLFNIAVWSITATAVLFHRRLPFGVFGLIAPLGFAVLCLRLNDPAVAFALIAEYTVVRVSPFPIGVSVVIAMMAASIAGPIIGGGADRGGVVVASLLLSLIVGLVGHFVTYQRRQEWIAALEKRVDSRHRRDELARSAREAVERERATIARELHDVVASAMTVVGVRAGVARALLDTEPEHARESLNVIERTIRKGLEELRGVLAGLHAGGIHPTLDALGPVGKSALGLGDLDALLGEYRLAGLDATVSIIGDLCALPEALESAVYRIVQESLTNVVRHAGPTRAYVRLVVDSSDLRIDIRDDGARSRGADKTTLSLGSGRGLEGMRQRALMLGGELHAGPYRSGFRVQARLPAGSSAMRRPGAVSQDSAGLQ